MDFLAIFFGGNKYFPSSNKLNQYDKINSLEVNILGLYSKLKKQ